MFLENVGSVRTSVLAVSKTPVVAASPDVVSGLKNGRNGVEIYNNSSTDIYFGDKNVAANMGIKIKIGEGRFFPVNFTSRDGLYVVSGADVTVVIAEYYA